MSGDMGGGAVSPPTTGGSFAPEPGGVDKAPTEGDQWLPRLTEQLNRPLSAWFCVLGWCASAALFAGLVAIFAGPSLVDTDQSIYSTWAIAHGRVACSYPSVSQLGGEPLIAPVYPLLSGGVAAIAQIGQSAPFPSDAALGPGCNKIFPVVNRWYRLSGALIPTLWIGCVSWLALMAGVIAWLRASGRGRRGWEPTTLIVIAGLLPVWMCVQTFFHPEDVLALGFALSAMACARRDRWVLAGVLCALAFLSQQFALLVAAPLFVLAPGTKRFSFATAGLVTGVIVVLPLAVITSGRVLRAVAVGTGNHPFPGGTVLWETHASGVMAVALFRVAPVVVSVVASWWVARRLGSGALEPVALMSLVACSLSLRLVFEVNFFSYYFMALAVSLILLDVTRGSLRRTVGAWFAMLILWICRLSPVPFGVNAWGVYLQNDLVSLFIGGFALMAVLFQLVRGGDRKNLWPWVAVAAVDLFTLSPFQNAFSTGRVVWFWQVVLVVPGIVLAAKPLLSRIRQPGATSSPAYESLPAPAA